MKAYTDLEQSKKLAEILPYNTADNTWERVTIAGSNFNVPEEQQYIHRDIPFTFFSGIGVPCWSLAALLTLYPITVGEDMGMYICWCNKHNLASRHYDNPVDACYEMILKLNKLKML